MVRWVPAAPRRCGLGNPWMAGNREASSVDVLISHVPASMSRVTLKV